MKILNLQYYDKRCSGECFDPSIPAKNISNTLNKNESKAEGTISHTEVTLNNHRFKHLSSDLLESLAKDLEGVLSKEEEEGSERGREKEELLVAWRRKEREIMRWETTAPPYSYQEHT